MSRRLLGLLVLGCLVVSLGPSARSRPDPTKPGETKAPLARLDALGDPLPPAALLRLGTLRFQQGGTVTALAFSKDGKSLFAASADSPLRAVDPLTGKD